MATSSIRGTPLQMAQVNLLLLSDIFDRNEYIWFRIKIIYIEISSCSFTSVSNFNLNPSSG